jgi:hypothetical protein
LISSGIVGIAFWGNHLRSILMFDMSNNF